MSKRMASKRIVFLLVGMVLLGAPLASLIAEPETSGGWKKLEANPVMGGKYGTCFDISVLRESDVYRMWLSWRPKASVALVESKDGIHWSEPPQIVLGPRKETEWENAINRPCVLKRADGYHMWYTGQANGHSWIGYATSPDGVSWKRMSDKPVLSCDQSWEKNIAVMCPSVLWDEEAKLFRMWYSGGEQNEPNAIGCATSSDGLTWKKFENNPIFSSEPKNPWEKHKVTACHVVRHKGWYVMFYIGFENEGKARICLARSKDGITNWQRHPENPIIFPGKDSWDHDACYKPYAIFDGTKWLLWYNGRRGHLEQIGVVLHDGEDLGFDSPQLSSKQTETTSDLKKVSFNEVDTIFSNPGQGWMGKRFQGSVEYYRFNWVEIEPEKGAYNWKPIDDRLARLQKTGGSLALRVMTASAHSSGYYSSPKWLFDLGCKGYEYNVGGGDPTSGGKAITRIEPEYADPIYLAEHAAFIAALGKRYDGHPNMEFLDIGSYGIWGEWHTKHPAPLAVRKQIVDMYVQAFRKTQMVFMTDDQEGLRYALTHGVGLRRDGVGSPWHEQNWIGSKKYANIPDMGNVWKKAPVVFEWYGNYDYLKSKNWSFDAAVNFMVSNHVSMINDNIGNVPPEAMPQLEKLARLAGYRFVLREIAYEQTAAPKRSLMVKMKWANVGVGKLYRPFKLQLALKDAAGQAVAAVTADTDPRDWLPGEREVTSTMQIPSVPSGTYALVVAITDTIHQRPPLKLAMDAPEKDGWYSVGSINVESLLK